MKLTIYRYDPDKDAAPYYQDYDVKLDIPLRGYDGKTSWVHPRAGLIPGRPGASAAFLRESRLMAALEKKLASKAGNK